MNGFPYDHRGHYVTRRCPDRNCGGFLQRDREPGYWRCDGLTHATDAGPLTACEHAHVDGKAFDLAPAAPRDPSPAPVGGQS